MAGSKLTLSNWATTNMIRYSELLRSVMPQHLRHAYFTSGRDEVLDKGLRSLRFHRTDADVAIGFSHQWLGNITAAARSLSHDEKQVPPFSFFNWPKIKHPAVVGHEASLKELTDTIANSSPNKFLGIVVELVGERSGLTFDDAFLRDLDAIRHNTKIPLIFVENASNLSRTGTTCFLSDSLSVKANMVLWYTGGQLGHVFVDDQFFVDKPLTLISTWDGDGISIARAYHALLNACQNNYRDNITEFDQLMSSLGPHVKSVGRGVWRAIKCRDEHALKQAIDVGRSLGVLFGHGFDHSLMVCPKPDSHRDDFLRIVEAVRQVLQFAR